jgi:hypothetical protein
MSETVTFYVVLGISITFLLLSIKVFSDIVFDKAFRHDVDSSTQEVEVELEDMDDEFFEDDNKE